MQPNYKHAQGIKKIHDMLCLIPSASRKKKCWPSDGIRTRQEAQLGHGQVGSRNGWVIFLSRELIKS